MPLSPLGGAIEAGPSMRTPPFDITQRPLSSYSAPSIIPDAAFNAGDRVKDTAASVTTSLVTLSKNNPSGFGNFKDGVGDGNYTFYVLLDTQGNWEAQYGVYSDAAGTLTRAAAPLASSTTPGVQVTFSGSVTVYGNWPASAELATAYGVRSGAFIGPFNRTVTNQTLRSSYVFYVPIYIPMPFSKVQMRFQISGTGPDLDIGLYSNFGGGPFKRLAQQTRIVPSVAGDQASTILSCGPCAQGLYWGALCVRNNGSGEGSKTFQTVQAVAARGDVMGTTATNASSLGFYETGVQLPIVASQAPRVATAGQFPFVPAIYAGVSP